MTVTRPIGTHVLVGRGLVGGALASARELGCEAIQVFVGNPRGWALAVGDPAEDERFRVAAAEQGIRVVVHAAYLVNPGSPTPGHYRRSIDLVAHTLGRAARMGAEGVVVHTGSYVDPSPTARAAALRRVRDGLLPILDTLDDSDHPDHPWLLLEPTAGQGRSLCAGVDDLPEYFETLDHHPRVGLCLDTCHVFAAGAPLDEPGGTTATIDRVVELLGPGRLRLIHANDSMDARGSARDRHQRLGEGRIGVGAFAELFAHPATAGIPFIAETPGSRDPGNPDLATLRALRSQAELEARAQLKAAG